MVLVDGALPARSRKVVAGVYRYCPLLVVDVSEPQEPEHAPVTVKVIVWLLLLSASVPVKVTVRVPPPLVR
jgi:hypothetical protein